MRRHPIGAALAAMLPLLVVAALPAQVGWAERLGAPERFGDRLRFLTVSPTLLFGERSGPPAYLLELLWAALFLTLLLAAAWRLATAVADDWTRPFVLLPALTVLAPVANLAALLVVHAGGLTTDATGRGAALARLLTDAQNASAHVMLVGLAGGLAVLLTHAERLWPRGDDGTPLVNRETALTVLRGPLPTLWRRIGVALLAAALAVPAMSVAGDVVAAVAEPVARLWCAGSPPGNACVPALTGLAGAEPVQLSHLLLDPGRERLLRIYTVQVFLLVFAVAYFQLHAQPLRHRPATTLLVVWFAYTAAVVAREGVVDASLDIADEPGLPGLLGLLLPPGGLASTLLAAPAVAVTFAAGHALVTRLRRGRQPSQPGVTSPAS
ncbi:hypothetical protein [Jiangella muralis]|uniref:hypothetical protein n=1 Tax=Jiangella muralis TaxID=702383 RepID=UPI00069E4B2A|nr:hypothetical protein [Jiangella muralis]